MIERPNPIELAFRLGGESTYSVVEDHRSAAGAANVVNGRAQKLNTVKLRMNHQ